MAGTANNVNTLQYIGANGVSYSEATGTNQTDPFRALASPYVGYMFPLSTKIILQSRQIQFAPNTLGTTNHIYTSPIYQDIIDLSNYFADWGCSYTITEGAIHSINVVAPWDTFTTQDWNISLFASEQWELVPNQGTKELKHAGIIWNPFEVPNTTAAGYRTLPTRLRVAVDAAKKNDTSLNLSASNMSAADVAALGPYMATAQTILMYYKSGIEAVPSYTQTLKRTAVIDKNNKNNAFNLASDTGRISYNNAGSINYMLSTPQLLFNYSINNTISSFLLPSYKKKMTITNIDPFTVYTYAGWLVKPPSFQFIGKNKIQLTQEFIWDEYIAGLYYIKSPSGDFPEVQVPQ